MTHLQTKQNQALRTARNPNTTNNKPHTTTLLPIKQKQRTRTTHSTNWQTNITHQTQERNNQQTWSLHSKYQDRRRHSWRTHNQAQHENDTHYNSTDPLGPATTQQTTKQIPTWHRQDRRDTASHNTTKTGPTTN